MYRRELTIGGKTLSIETGKLAKQADGSAIVRYGDTVVIVTACCASTEREGIDFLPLTVDYREYAFGRCFLRVGDGRPRSSHSSCHPTVKMILTC
jgi:polyribonucleotide nucleotidyltransferase